MGSFLGQRIQQPGLVVRVVVVVVNSVPRTKYYAFINIGSVQTPTSPSKLASIEEPSFYLATSREGMRTCLAMAGDTPPLNSTTRLPPKIPSHSY